MRGFATSLVRRSIVQGVAVKIRGKLTYANVVASLALFIAIGGASAFAATELGKNSVGSKQLRKNAVTAAKIKKGAVTGAKINLGTLGTVPHATTADALGGLSASQITAAAKLRCPAGTRLGGGVCFEESARPATSLQGAMTECAEDDRKLPTMGELVAYEIKYLTAGPPYEWVEAEYVDAGASSIFSGMLVTASRNTSGEGAVAISNAGASNSFSYHCVTWPVNG
jgi:hypothetical protein